MDSVQSQFRGQVKMIFPFRKVYSTSSEIHLSGLSWTVVPVINGLFIGHRRHGWEVLVC